MEAAGILLIGTLTFAAPLILAAIGGLASERSGIINIALEGNMLVAAALTAIVSHATGNPWLGIGAGIGSSTVTSWLHWLLTQIYRVDHIVSGMAINIVAYGAADYLTKRFIDPNVGRTPVLNVSVFYSVAFVVPVAAALYLRYTRGGLRLLAVSSDPSKSREMGLFPVQIRFIALTATGVLCGIAGALILMNAGYYITNITAGRGYIALAALILGSWKPLPTLAAALIFGLFQALQFQLQGTTALGVQIPREIWLSLPYLVTIVALAGFLGKGRAPAGLGKY